jgi:hypothetical protein
VSADADELIAGQYADRAQLRPVLDAVLAALPALGPVTVQARKTFVSLATPRRVFAVVQPTTKSRVDLGLRLDQERPGGRLLTARDVGASTLRIPLTGPGDVDGEVLGWLRRAYAENAAPPPPRRPARRPAPVLGQLTVVIEGSGMPGLSCPPSPGGEEHHNIHIALATKNRERRSLVIRNSPWLAAGPVPGDAPAACWQARVTVRRDADGLDFSGPDVRGDRSDRHLFLAWGDVEDDGTLRLVRGSKLKFAGVDRQVIEDALRPGQRLLARIRLTGTTPGESLTWSAGPADAEPR